MAKLSPTFAYMTKTPTSADQKPEDMRLEFQSQLGQEHINVANAINATIDDISFFTTERQTSYYWVTGKPIFTKTIPTSAWTAGGTVNTIPLNISLAAGQTLTIINIVCTISNGTITLLMPNVDVAVAANEISIVRNGTNIVLTSGGTNYSAYSGYVTVYYTKN